ncbi:L-erythro-3,5-diaminohexanoate dehydrogenase [Bacillus horti]|uniref:L-erythro-3,5-diaminohexanoate dehydrogenase n=1 Tax=Caldalkalibacillus horti TaxID=77523 RepID=A0ABT9VW33_9BACI|nr:L-erythro-3,5-diaminohexanoate dehydrogenase [Bacillus horti]MDQ0165095.1 L-erythro-3,5-diaminohexanoate dehydrogenase [Bacillus horti]
MKGQKYGCHRVLEPANSLPQPAQTLNPDLPIYDNELLINVERLNIDSASFLQLKSTANHHEVHSNEKHIADQILAIVRERGKLHNPVTGSGGMLIGTVKEKGRHYPSEKLKIGERIASLISLTLTPLYIEEILSVDLDTAQVEVKGHAILFESSPYAVLPQDIPEALALGALDVCGAPAQVQQLVKEGDTVLVLGAGGKSGLLATYQAKKSVGEQGRVIAVEYGEESCASLRKLKLADEVLQADATQAMELYDKVVSATTGMLADVVINCVNVPHTEMTSILCTKEGGITYFFSMATSFTAAALGAEGVGKDIQLMIGNGYTRGHAELTLGLLRESQSLQEYMLGKYVNYPPLNTKGI